MIRNMKRRATARRMVLLQIDIHMACIAACELQLSKIQNFVHPSYRMIYMQMVEYYNAIFVLQRDLYGCGLFWIITGKRWLLRHYLKKLCNM